MKSTLDPKLIKACFAKPELTEFNKVLKTYFDCPIEIIPLEKDNN